MIVALQRAFFLLEVLHCSSYDAIMSAMKSQYLCVTLLVCLVVCRKIVKITKIKFVEIKKQISKKC